MTDTAHNQKRKTSEMTYILGLHAITIDDQVIEKIEKKNQDENPVFSLGFCIELVEQYESIVDYFINRYEGDSIEKANK